MAGRRWGAAAAVVLLTLAASACGVVFDAPKITVQVRENDIVYAEAEGETRVTGGETVLTVRNSSSQERQIILARIPSGDLDIPQELLMAERPRDDARILGFSPVLEPEETDYGAGGFGVKTDDARFHIYLHPGENYVLFDRLSGGEDGVILWLRPGEQAG